MERLARRIGTLLTEPPEPDAAAVEALESDAILTTTDEDSARNAVRRDFSKRSGAGSFEGE